MSNFHLSLRDPYLSDDGSRADKTRSFRWLIKTKRILDQTTFPPSILDRPFDTPDTKTFQKVALLTLNGSLSNIKGKYFYWQQRERLKLKF